MLAQLQWLTFIFWVNHHVRFKRNSKFEISQFEKVPLQGLRLGRNWLLHYGDDL